MSIYKTLTPGDLSQRKWRKSPSRRQECNAK